MLRRCRLIGQISESYMLFHVIGPTYTTPRLLSASSRLKLFEYRQCYIINAKCYAITYMVLDATERKSNEWVEDLRLPLRAIALNRRLSHPERRLTPRILEARLFHHLTERGVTILIQAANAQHVRRRIDLNTLRAGLTRTHSKSIGLMWRRNWHLTRTRHSGHGRHRWSRSIPLRACGSGIVLPDEDTFHSRTGSAHHGFGA